MSQMLLTHIQNFLFAASASWFEHFKGCHGFHNLKLTNNAAEEFPALQWATEEHAYMLYEVFFSG
jgi:hypothetical protein